MLLSSIIVFAVLFCADLLTKHFICGALIEQGGSMRFIPGLIRFQYTQNTGMAWGMLKNSTLLLTIFTLIACCGMLFFLIKKGKKMPLGVRIALVMVLAGAAGNLVDRIALGYVRDFIAFDFIDFPIFNFADSCVTIGAILLFVILIFTKKGREFFKNLDEEKQKPAEAETGSDEH